MDDTPLVLCVDGDAAARRATAAAFEDAGYRVTAVESADAARDALDESPAALVTAASLPDDAPLDLVRDARDAVPDVVAVVFTETPPDDLATAETEDAVADYVSKSLPDAREFLVDVVEQSLTARTQTAYPLPDDEDARLDDLARYAADPGELASELDRLTDLAARLFDAPIVAVGVLDRAEQRFLSCHGASLPAVPREETVCTYAMLEDGVTVVEDVQSDPRFAANAVLDAEGIRFYASANIRSPDGHVLGTFCVYDTAPRTFSDADRDALRAFAADAATHFAHHERRGDAGGESRA